MLRGVRARRGDLGSPVGASWQARHRGAGGRDRQRGQSLVEFALILPILLLLALMAVDFGRVYLGWINLQNMARIAANYAANNAAALSDANPDLTAYTNQIANDAQATNCPLAPGQPAAPTFKDADGDGFANRIGDRAEVTLTCRFHVITPLISLIVGSDLNVTATSVFPVKQGLAETSSGGGGGGGGCLAPSPAIRATPSTSGTAPLTVNFMDSSGGGAGTSWLWTFKDSANADAFPASTLRDPGNLTFTTPGTYTVNLQVSNACGTASTSPGTTISVSTAATPKLCTVPSFNGVKRNAGQGIWTTAGFTTTVQDGPNAPKGNGWTIVSQSIVGASSVPCTSTISVNNP
jgi:PKD repeat protein